jgi:hypothetical protein
MRDCSMRSSHARTTHLFGRGMAQAPASVSPTFGLPTFLFLLLPPNHAKSAHGCLCDTVSASIVASTRPKPPRNFPQSPSPCRPMISTTSSSPSLAVTKMQTSKKARREYFPHFLTIHHPASLSIASLTLSQPTQLATNSFDPFATWR